MTNGGLNLGDTAGAIDMSTQGSGPALSAGTVIPVSWGIDFSISGDPAWQLSFTLADLSTRTILATNTFSGNNGGAFFGNESIITNASSNAGDTLNLAMKLVEQGDSEGGLNVTVQIPESGSVDVGPVSFSPEPATIGIAGAGLAFLWWRRKVRRA